MAILDSLAIFSRDQDLSDLDISYSQRSMNLKALADYGAGRNAYIECICGGAFDKYLRVQLVGAVDEKLTDIKVISDSGVKDKAELVAGHIFYVPFSITDKKYKVIFLRFILSPDIASNDESATVSSGEAFKLTEGYAAPPEVGEEKAEKANTISAHLVLTPSSQVMYDYANADKATV